MQVLADALLLLGGGVHHRRQPFAALAQRLFHSGALGDLGLQAVVERFQFGGALGDALLQRGVEFADDLLGTLAVGDVPRGRGHRHRLPRVVAQRRQGDTDIEDAAVLAQALRFPHIHGLTLAQPFQHGRRFRAQRRRHQLFGAHRQRFRLRVAIHPLSGLIPDCDPAGKVPHQDGIIGVHQDRGEQPLPLHRALEQPSRP